MADYHVGSGQTYATIADALVDIVALGSTQWTEDTRIVLHTGTYAEVLDYGTTYGWNLGSTAEFPLTYTVNDGDTVEVTGSGGTYVGQNYMGNIRFENINFTGGGVLNLTKYGGQITFENCSMSLNGYCYIYPNSHPNGGAVIFTDCDIHHTGLYQIILSSTNSSFIFNRCKISSDNQVSLFYGANNTAIQITNSRFYNINVAHASTPSSVNILQSTFNGASKAFLECPVGYGYIKNCIFANLPAIFTTAGSESIPVENIAMDGNVYDTVTAFASGTIAIADLAAAKTLGIEGDNSLEQSVTFQSTDYTSEDFLKISASIGNAVTCGINEDAFGTARQRYGNIDGGAHQYAPVVTSSSGESPTQPDLSIVDSGDGSHATATVSGSDEGTTNTIYIAPYGSTSWTDQGGVLGDGELELSVSAGKYWAYCISTNSTRSTAAAIETFAITADQSYMTDLRQYVHGELLADSAISQLLAGTDSIYCETSNIPVVYPCVTLSFVEKETESFNSNEIHSITFTACCYGESEAVLELLTARLKANVEGMALDSSSVSLRKISFSGASFSSVEGKGDEGKVIRKNELVFKFLLVEK
jgi:hypothetical protein